MDEKIGISWRYTHSIQTLNRRFLSSLLKFPWYFQTKIGKRISKLVILIIANKKKDLIYQSMKKIKIFQAISSDQEWPKDLSIISTINQSNWLEKALEDAIRKLSNIMLDQVFLGELFAIMLAIVF